ncbi:glycosyltransferase family 4 protein [Devosia sp. YIM 151766]|uniref:glycosyltransferase family 4 protein n=1 Tax=Devosia sp. YIM 151766 TaxID=3017325 RepID=UPI00255CEEDE|nr:glycosyltransferase family 4 protein [Devosia sp. YIM 151766]WIY51561.1 glycosyltransferase family 4 protein [Devosia sp. YIM 151766]
MKVLISSHAYWPAIGGLEVTAENIARRAAADGHEVIVITQTASAVERNDGVAMVRGPNPLRLLSLFRWADRVIARHPSVRLNWPVLVTRKPFTIWYASHVRGGGGILSGWLLRRIEAAGFRIANSEFVRGKIPGCAAVIFPGYDEQVFRREIAWSSRAADFIFVGRLEPEKGIQTLIEAMQRFPHSRLTIVGRGSGQAGYECLAGKLGLQARISFAGAKSQAECNALLNRHKVLVVPSRYEEPFGKVAVEGLAAGCRVVVSDRGGLKEAGGPAALLFRAGEVGSLAHAMAKALEPAEHLRLLAEAHVADCTFAAAYRQLARLAGLDGGVT